MHLFCSDDRSPNNWVIVNESTEQIDDCMTPWVAAELLTGDGLGLVHTPEDTLAWMCLFSCFDVVD